MSHDHRANRREEGGDRAVSLVNRLHRLAVKYVLQLVAASAGLLAGTMGTCASGVFALPSEVRELKAQVSGVIGRQRADSVRTDSLYRTQAGILSVLCFGLSDQAFDDAKQTCGEAFAVSRIIARERVQREAKP